MIRFATKSPIEESGFVPSRERPFASRRAAFVGSVISTVLFLSVASGCKQSTTTASNDQSKSGQPVQGDPEPQGHPLQNAQVGEWAVYRVTSGKATVDYRKKVTAKTDAEVSFSISGSIKGPIGGNLTGGSEKINFADPFQPIIMMTFLLNPTRLKLDYKKLDSGNETLTIAGKTYETKWTSYEMTGTYEGVQIKPAQGKVWLSASAPFGGVVKTEFDGIGIKSASEIQSFGGP